MLEILGIIITVVMVVVGGIWAVLKVLLPKLMDAAISRIEHSQNQEIKHLESRLELHSTALFNSMNIASRIEDNYRTKAIDAISTLWKEFIRIKNEFAPVVAIESVATEKEFVSAISGSNEENEMISSVLKEYSSFELVTKKIAGSDEKKPTGMEIAFGSGTQANRLDETRVFVSERLFRIFNCMVSVHGRLGFLISQGVESGKGKTWKSDPVMEEIVLGIFPREVWEQVVKMKFAGLKALIGLLEQQFVLEAKKSMRGFEELADSVSEVSQITQEEEARARLRRDYL